MKEWQFNILFLVGVGGAVFLLFAPDLGFEKATNPTSVTGVGAILTYILTQKAHILGKDKDKDEDKKDEEVKK